MDRPRHEKQLTAENKLPFKVFIVDTDAQLRSRLAAKTRLMQDDRQEGLKSFQVLKYILVFKGNESGGNAAESDVTTLTDLIHKQLQTTRIGHGQLHLMSACDPYLDAKEEQNTFFWIATETGKKVDSDLVDNLPNIFQQALNEM